MLLYRPVGIDELLLIYGAAMRRFPPRLPEQPIFYPVLNAQYAEEISRDWNATSGAMAGYVTEFEVDDLYGRSFEVRQVGAQRHQELWVPAESLDEFNSHIQGQIRLISAFFGPGFVGVVPTAHGLRGMDARAQLDALRVAHEHSPTDLHRELAADHQAVFANFPFWEQCAGADPSLMPVLNAVSRAWSGAFPAVQIGLQPPTQQ